MKSLIHITLGLIRNTRARRWTMFVVVLTAVVMVFLGSTFLERILEPRPLGFIGYWLVCTWLTLLAMLLAGYDLLMVRASARTARQSLKRRIDEEVRAHENAED